MSVGGVRSQPANHHKHRAVLNTLRRVCLRPIKTTRGEAYRGQKVHVCHKSRGRRTIPLVQGGKRWCIRTGGGGATPV